MSKQERLCNIPVLSQTSLKKLSEGEGTPRCFTLKVMSTTWLAHLVSRFACNARVIVDASSNPPVSRLKLL